MTIGPGLASGTRRGALAGIVVADFSRVLAGPYLTMMLADLGATVIKVESPAGDGTRQWGPPWHDGESTYFEAINRNKRSIVLDLTLDQDQELAVELARRADVLVQNLLPGRMADFGLAYEDVRAINEQVVYCSISGFGSSSAGAALPGYDLLAQAATGLMSITGPLDGRPQKSGVAIVDLICGLHGAVGVLAALAARDRMGCGQHVEVDLISAGLAALTNQAAAHLLAAAEPKALGNAHPSVAPYEPFPASDGEVVIAAGTDRHFRQLCAALGLDGLVRDERFTTNALRVAHRMELVTSICGATTTHTRDHLISLLTQAGVPCSAINSVSEAFTWAERIGLDVVWTDGGDRYVRNPITMDVTPPRFESRPPALDADGAEIRQWLMS